MTLRPTIGLLLRLVCSIALLFSGLPSRAGVVCVENGRVVASCWMTSLPERKASATHEASPRRRMACCLPRAAARPGVAKEAVCPAHKGTRCAYAYRPGPSAVAGTKAVHPEIPLLLIVAVPAPSFGPLACDALHGPRGPAFSDDSEPPRSPPRAPDRGRAPPVV